MQTAYQYPKVLQSVFRQFVCCQIDVDYIEKGLFVSLLRFGRFVEPLDETLQLGPRDGGLVGCRVDLLLQQVGQGFKPASTFSFNRCILIIMQHLFRNTLFGICLLQGEPSAEFRNGRSECRRGGAKCRDQGPAAAGDRNEAYDMMRGGRLNRD